MARGLVVLWQWAGDSVLLGVVTLEFIRQFFFLNFTTIDCFTFFVLHFIHDIWTPRFPESVFYEHELATHFVEGARNT